MHRGKDEKETGAINTYELKNAILDIIQFWNTTAASAATSFCGTSEKKGASNSELPEILWAPSQLVS